MNNIIKVTSPDKAYYTVVYWSRILSLPLYYILLIIVVVVVADQSIRSLVIVECSYSMYVEDVIRGSDKMRVMRSARCKV